MAEISKYRSSKRYLYKTQSRASFEKGTVQPLYPLQPSLSAICMRLSGCKASRKASLWVTPDLIFFAESGLTVPALQDNVISRPIDV